MKLLVNVSNLSMCKSVVTSMALIFGNKVYTNPHEISSNDSLVFPRYKSIRFRITYGSIVKWIQNDIAFSITFEYTKVIYSWICNLAIKHLAHMGDSCYCFCNFLSKVEHDLVVAFFIFLTRYTFHLMCPVVHQLLENRFFPSNDSLFMYPQSIKSFL